MKATGFLKHYFHGDYCCSIGLTFECPESAEAALALLPGWTQGEKNQHILVTTIDSAELDKFKAKAKKWGLEIKPCGREDCDGQCKGEEIDGVPHSIDYGPTFTLDVPAEPLNQMHLPIQDGPWQVEAKENHYGQVEVFVTNASTGQRQKHSTVKV
jgi:hypothetical protein